MLQATLSLRLAAAHSLLLAALGLLDGGLDSLRALLSRHHQLEAIKVAHVGTSLLRSQLLTPCRRSPLLHHFSVRQSLLEGLLTRATNNLARHISDAQTLEWHHVTAHTCETLWAVHDDTLLVHNVYNCAHLVCARPICDESQTARLHEAGVHGHCCRVLL